jgi:hypothetical protein
MPSTEYETRTDSVLAWKKSQKLGRFDPNAPDLEEQKIKASEREVEERGTYVPSTPLLTLSTPTAASVNLLTPQRHSYWIPLPSPSLNRRSSRRRRLHRPHSPNPRPGIMDWGSPRRAYGKKRRLRFRDALFRVQTQMWRFRKAGARRGRRLPRLG